MTQEHDVETVERVAKAIWDEIRYLEDRCDMEWDDMPRNHTHFVAARAALSAMPAREVTGWQPIETAPKDGTVFDAWCSDHTGYTDAPKRIANCRYLDGVLEYRHSHGWFMLNKLEFSHARLTHWVPLPSAPAGV